MGCFGYICKGCNTPINGNCWHGGENCVLIHVRNGKELGRVEGHYDEYGRVIEQKDMNEDEKFRGNSNGINGHSEICNSQFSFGEDSGVAAWHHKCYEEASNEEQNDLTPSEGDPDQSWGEVRDEFK